ncbi:hypothetical protein PBI_BRIDGETTE_58 [Arthrobacter phage Bridgette]|uniref:Uncharacterized protein n=1 Tax=Arthrobacter phage Bridgette TaxID=2419949 RepID=A0A3G2KEA3_9CAUD|nr:hypothetical protein HOU46_gp58 [Arthrobacter phage Bridgette]AYN57324.1 hypothetical protein PBI_BRIDGETTE_58 [Arthrobacter phage Bridgette]
MSKLMSTRDELTTLILGKTAPRAADAILAAGYRKPYTITTLAELEALPDESVIRDFSGDVAEKRAGVWCSYETAPMSDTRMAKYLPGIVLHEPEARS